MKLVEKFLTPVILLLSVLALVVMYLNYDSDPAKQGAATDIGLQASYGLFILALIGIVVGFTLTAITDPKSVLRSAVGVGFILLIWGIAHATAGNEVNKIYQEFKVDAALSQLIGGMLGLTLTLGFLAVLGIIVTEVMSAVK